MDSPLLSIFVHNSHAQRDYPRDYPRDHLLDLIVPVKKVVVDVEYASMLE
ncbi:MAG: hypothetical protein ACHQUC_08055 [Chlamydiales bacterium]